MAANKSSEIIVGKNGFPVLCIISFMVGTPTNVLLVIFRGWIRAINLVWRLKNNH